jgi:cation diffusion facilitator CzcD-associated flavoprotein CzcO
MDAPLTNEAKTARAMLDAVVIGAGFAGLCMLHKLRNELGLQVRCYDKATGVGGTWYWNRYPGARSDTESFVYSYSFDRKLYEDWKWSDRYPRQPEILAYLEHVADRYDLRRSISFGTAVTQAHFNEATNRWDIATDTGEQVSAKWLITGLGLLSAPNLPDIKGLSTFQGAVYHTARWPKQKVDFTGKRVGVVGTGSTGVQVVTELGPLCKQLTVFQRRPQYSVPARHGPLPAAEVEHIMADYDRYFEEVRRSGTCFGFAESTTPTMSVSEAERELVFEDAWEKGGGFRFMFGTFNDIAIDTRANEAAAEFIRKKIAQIVKDPKKAAALTPHDYYARRPLCDAGYFETFNRDSVSIADITKYPIIEVNPTGIRTEEGQFDLDILIFATGFDAVTGNFVRIDFRGRGGEALKDKWEHGPRAYFGLSIAGFPNMFTLYGPPGPFTNQPPAIEWQCQWVADTIKYAETNGVATIEATAAAEQAWLDDCIAIAESTLFAKLDWWVMGTNIPGKPRSVSFFMGGMGAYIERLEKATEQGYTGFLLSRETLPQMAAAG